VQNEETRSVWPRSPAGRVFALIWVLPVALLGGVAASIFSLVGWTRPKISDGALDLVCSGPFARWMAGRHWAAFTFGPCIWYWTPAAGVHPRIRRHEREHVRQFLRWGLLMILAYPLASLWATVRGRHSYYDNHFEKAARLATDE
jgi:hypothetical protein